MVILERLLHRYADERIRGEVNDAVDPVFTKHFGEPFFITQIYIIYSVHLNGISVSGLQIIEYDDLNAFILQVFYRMRTDIPAAARY